MRSLRQRFSVVAVSAGLMTSVFGVLASPAHGSVTTDCAAHLSGSQNGALAITTIPAAGSSVPAGSSIQISATWDNDTFDEIDRLASCVTWDGNFHPSMSSTMKGIGTGRASSSTSSLLVPADMPVGSDLCIRDVLFGDGGTRSERSNTVCFTSAAAVTVETPTTTTTMAPTTTTTTTAAPAVTQQEPVGQPAGGPATPGEMVQGEVISQPVPLAELPRTGSDSVDLAALGAITMGLGILAVVFGRRRTVRA